MAKSTRVYVSKLTQKRGKYGKSKVKAFFSLEEANGRWITARELCLLTGIGYRSLGTALPRWVGFGYVVRQPHLAFGQGDYEYKLLTKGKTWLKLAAGNLPNFPAFRQEQKAWQELVESSFTHLLSLGFVYFVEELRGLANS